MKIFWGLFLGGLVLSTSELRAIQIVTEDPKLVCEEFQITKELKVYRDPALFISKMKLLAVDPSLGWREIRSEKPVLTSLKGTVHLVRLAPPQPFKNFKAYAELYEMADPGFSPRPLTNEGRPDRSPLIVPVKLCGNEGYLDALGFMLKAEFDSAQLDDGEINQLPPSTPRNGIPKFPRSEVAGR
jgi:hypothetical protein